MVNGNELRNNVSDYNDDIFCYNKNVYKKVPSCNVHKIASVSSDVLDQLMSTPIRKPNEYSYYSFPCFDEGEVKDDTEQVVDEDKQEGNENDDEEEDDDVKKTKKKKNKT